MVSGLHASGGGRLVAVSCVDGEGNPLMPCGRCRQLLWEHGGPDCLVDFEDGPLRMAELLPHAFDQGRLAAGQPALRDDVDEVAGPGPGLIEYLGRDNAFPHGVILLTGTGLVPASDFTLQAGDEVEISVEDVGTLRNPVARGDGRYALAD